MAAVRIQSTGQQKYLVKITQVTKRLVKFHCTPLGVSVRNFQRALNKVKEHPLILWDHPTGQTHIDGIRGTR